MSESFLGDRVTLHCGDCLDVLATLPPDTFHSSLADPPYHFASIIKRWSRSGPLDRTSSGAMGRHSRGFMGTTWDGGDVAFRPETWAAVLRVLKPGAHLVAFGAPKNVHRLTCAIEDAGFEIRDQLMWLFGVGFPKNHDAKKAMGKADDVDLFREHLERAADKWEGWGTALKPAYEPIVLAQKPLAGTVQENLREHGTGGINIDACRVGGIDEAYARNCSGDRGHDDNRTREMEFGMTAGKASTVGRWPANLLHDGSDEVVDLFPDSAGAQGVVRGTEPSAPFQDIYNRKSYRSPEVREPRGDSGSAARFFYCTKATKTERAGSKHPTVKPVSPLRYFARLITPPGGLILDPFAGTGTTAQAALLEGFRATLIEREPQYQADIRTRLARLQADAAPVLSEAAE